MADELDELPELSRLASRLEPALRREFLAAVETVKNKIVLEELAKALISGNLSHVEAAANIEALQLAIPKVGNILARGFSQGIGFAIGTIEDLALGIDLALVNVESVRWAEQSAASMIVGIAESQRDIIADIVARSTKGEFDVYEAAKEIKKHIGLDKRRKKAVERFELRLREQGIAEAKIEKRVEKYIQAQLKDRSLSIARTEIINAANSGQQALWLEGIKQGWISKQLMVKTWIATPDDRLDVNICEPLDEATAEIDEPFQTNAGDLMGPPAHPRCRCAMGLVKRSG